MRDSRGFALVWALFLVVLLGALGMTVLERDQTVRRDAATDLEAVTAFHAAEGGLAWARHALAADSTWSGGARRVGPCEVEVVAKPVGDAAWAITSRARPGAARIEARVERRGDRIVVTEWEERR